MKAKLSTFLVFALVGLGSSAWAQTAGTCSHGVAEADLDIATGVRDEAAGRDPLRASPL